MKTNVALLARVSDRSQEDNSSLEAQLQRCRTYCHEHGYQIISEMTEIISGVFVLARSGFGKLLDLAAEGKISVIVVDRPDRLGRGDAIAKLELLAQLNNARVEYATSSHNVDTVEGLAMKATEQLVSGIERINIRRRTLGGKYEWAKRGRVIVTPYRPFGYRFATEVDSSTGRKVSSSLEIVESEASLVRRIYELCVNECMTTRGIATTLMKEGIPSPKGSDIWTRSTVYLILKSTVYKGEWRYGKVEQRRLDTPAGIKHSMRRRPDTDAVAVKVPAIIDEEQWEAAQAQLRANSRKFLKPTKHQYLLRSRIKCAACGRSICGRFDRSSKGGNRSYCCTAYYEKRCKSRSVRADAIEEVIWEKIKEVLLDEEKLIEGAKKGNTEAAKEHRLTQQIITTLDSQTQKVRSQMDKLIDLYTNEDITREEYQSRRRKLEEQISKFESERTQHLDKLRSFPLFTTLHEENLRRFRAEVTGRINGEMTFEEKQKLLEILQIEVFYDYQNRSAKISGAIGGYTVSITSSCTLQSACRRCASR